jgi:hypothetical protein
LGHLLGKTLIQQQVLTLGWHPLGLLLFLLWLLVVVVVVILPALDQVAGAAELYAISITF